MANHVKKMRQRAFQTTTQVVTPYFYRWVLDSRQVKFSGFISYGVPVVED